MKQIILSIIVLVSYVLQLTLIPEFLIFGVQADLLLVVTCSIAFLFGSLSGSLVGLSLGILLDLYQGRAIGFSAMIFFYLGIFIGGFNKKFFKDNYLIVLIIIVFSTLIYGLLVYTFAILMYSQEFMILQLVKNLFVSTLANIILSIIIYPVLLKINLGLEVHRNIFK